MSKTYLKSPSCPAYTCWAGMCSRIGRVAGYKDCTMSDEWEDFQTFAQWYFSQPRAPYETYHLDKDMFVKGNRHYSAETCLLVPGWINQMVSRPQNTGKYPSCVTKRGDKYYGNFRFNSRMYSVDPCYSEEEICNSLFNYRRKLVNDIADQYERENYMSPKAIEAFRAYDFGPHPKNTASSSSCVAPA